MLISQCANLPGSGMTVAMLGLQAPATPEGMDTQSAMLLMLVESPLLALVLALLARHLAGGFWMRSLMLFLLTWITNSVNTQIEAAAFASMAGGFWFTVLTFLFPVLLVSMAVAWLFSPAQKTSFMDAARSFFSRRSAGGWAWRLGLALFYLVGFQSLLIASWMPWSLRLPHMIDILCDEFIYAAALIWLMRMGRAEQQIRHEAERTNPVHA